VYLELTDEQQFLVEAATGTLSRHDTFAAARAALDGEPYPDLWPLACEAGWPGLISAEAVDGAGLGAYEAMLVLEACGARLADARLIGHLTAVALLEAAGHADTTDLRRALASGERRAALVEVDDTGRADQVLDAEGADVLVVLTPDGVTVLEAADVTVTPRAGYDATRALASVHVHGGQPLEVAAQHRAGAHNLGLALLAAESVGSASACLAMAREYAIDRQAFGRSIGSYQSIKHKLVEMMRRIENARSLLVPAGRAWAAGDHDGFALAAAAARVGAADALDYAAPENIFIHGGIGATWEHDAQLFYRRAELSRRLAGGVEAAAEAVANELLRAA
jgi:alkylation response protein AidB-like acyl-CoA dehydrogenase